jgi:hypothetical protein
MRFAIASVILFACTQAALAEVQTQAIEYMDEDVPLTGHLYWDDAIEGSVRASWSFTSGGA